MKALSKEWVESKLPNEDGQEIGAGCPASDLFGTSDWRAQGWEDMAKTATTGDMFRGLRKDGTWWSVTVRVLEGFMEGRHYCRFVYAGWHENGRDCETSWECFATLCSRIESVPNLVIIHRS